MTLRLAAASGEHGQEGPKRGRVESTRVAEQTGWNKASMDRVKRLISRKVKSGKEKSKIE